uniref:E2 NEDD8-conjugating enzyme n=1 Tax=Syphacia muris TaxID=451379 RepID=A0A0N5AHW7_9BILA
MLNLQKRIRGEDEDKAYLGKRISIRDKLLTQEVQELETSLRKINTCKAHFPSTSTLHKFELIVTPSEGMYKNGVFRFSIEVPPEYNNVPPIVKCLTRVWHPNITEDGAICLSLLRQNSLDGYGWMPTRHLIDVVLGLDSLFTDLIDFDDALNAQAAQQWSANRDAFQQKVREYIHRYC